MRSLNGCDTALCSVYLFSLSFVQFSLELLFVSGVWGARERPASTPLGKEYRGNGSSP